MWHFSVQCASAEECAFSLCTEHTSTYSHCTFHNKRPRRGGTSPSAEYKRNSDKQVKAAHFPTPTSQPLNRRDVREGTRPKAGRRRAKVFVVMDLWACYIYIATTYHTPLSMSHAHLLRCNHYLHKARSRWSSISIPRLWRAGDGAAAYLEAGGAFSQR